jgi:acylphosphatase
MRAVSSVGRALDLHSKGRGFKSLTAHMEEFHAIVKGRVQMVMYRDFATRAAHKLGVAGRVRNLPDGTVEVVAQGERKNLETFIARLQKGPILARVDDVRVDWKTPHMAFDSFEILY